MILVMRAFLVPAIIQVRKRGVLHSGGMFREAGFTMLLEPTWACRERFQKRMPLNLHVDGPAFPDPSLFIGSTQFLSDG